MNNNDKIFIVVSIIYLSDKPLSYSFTRSVFTPEERIEQTIKTVQSIRERASDAKIILLESGFKKDLPSNLLSLVDEYLYIGDKKIIRFACDGKFKGLGEVASLLSLRKTFNKKSDYFKISGRYYLNNKFNISEWNDGDFNFKFRTKSSFSTVFYKFRGGVAKYFLASLLLTIPFCFLNRSIERVIFRFIPKNKIKKISQIGVSGLIAVDGSEFSE